MSTNTLIGRRLGNYKIESLIAEGGMSSVYEGVHMLLGRRVAIKQLNPILEQKDGIKERLKNEAITLSKLKHPHIVAIFDYIECELGTFIVEEIIKGIPLNEYLKNESGPIPEQKAIKYMLQMLDAIGYMHSKNIIHRDIKPGNFVITPDNEIKILDFGIAQFLDSNAPHLTQPGTKVGTALYMSPQQVKGQTLDRRTDIYSLGITFFHMITGQHPYSSKLTEYEIYNKIINDPLPPPSSIYAGVSPAMEEIIYKATAKRPLDRYQDCNALRRDIMAIKPQNEPKSTMADTQLFDLAMPSDKEKSQSMVKNAIMMVVVAVFIIAVAISLFTFRRHDQMHVIADNTFLYAADSLTAHHVDNLNYGETVRTSSDKPEVTAKDGSIWIEATSLRGVKGLVPKKHVASAKIYQQMNSMFSNKEAIEQTPTEYKQILWKYFLENKYFKNSTSLWEITGELTNGFEYNGTANGQYNGKESTDFACVLHHTTDKKCKILIFFDGTSESISLDFDSEVKIRTIEKGEKGGGWFIGNTYTRTMGNGSQYEVNKYEFLPTDGLLILNIEKEITTVCFFNAEENKIHLIEQPK
ncbi:MAG: serine/threonine protein kinase [Bacteroidales bacterium]|nr:serine/threonine protein kinase [Bacteroidales bacterium]